MYQHAFSALPTDVAVQVVDIVEEDNSYDTLKRTVICSLSDSQEKSLQQSLLEAELGDSITSQLLHHMQRFVGKIRVDNIILRQLSMKCLPANMATCLATSINRSSLGKLAEMTDKIQELYDRPRVHAVEASVPSPPPLQQPDVLTRLLQKIESLM
ncbi:unnamed protein product [Hymenolepis diminuta]|uniref:DUF7041 domain-containing protein n=1 Tax=Hymenolepis diminuta TaxID=6216 RepID=A0A564YW16_HYMDI|nr:unnamed protein product [Hymenolepis diminuta]